MRSYYAMIIVVALLPFVFVSVDALPQEIGIAVGFEEVIGLGVKPLVFLVYDAETEEILFDGIQQANTNLTIGDISGGEAETQYVDHQGREIGRISVLYDIVDKPYDDLWQIDGWGVVMDFSPQAEEPNIMVYDFEGYINFIENRLVVNGVESER